VPIDNVPADDGVSYSGVGDIQLQLLRRRPNRDRSSVPLGLGVTTTTVFSGRPINIGMQYFINAVRPDSWAQRQLRFSMSLLYEEVTGIGVPAIDARSCCTDEPVAEIVPNTQPTSLAPNTSLSRWLRRPSLGQALAYRYAADTWGW
jgi:hypothetical protein